jgi:hypothetical protein
MISRLKQCQFTPNHNTMNPPNNSIPSSQPPEHGSSTQANSTPTFLPPPPPPPPPPTFATPLPPMMAPENAMFMQLSSTPIGVNCDDNASGSVPNVAAMPCSHATNFADNADYSGNDLGEFDFPVHCLPPELAHLANVFSESVRLPKEMTALSMLGVLSSAIGTGLEIQTWEGPLRANIFVLIAARSGSGKTKLCKLLTAPLHELEREWQQNWRCNVLPVAKAEVRLCESKLKDLQKQACNPKHDQTKIAAEMAIFETRLDAAREKQVEPRMIVADITREKLAVTISQQPYQCLASISSEARGVIDVLAGRYNSSSHEDIYLITFSGDEARIDRLSRPGVQLHRPCLSLLWMTQPDKLERLLGTPNFSESGFLPRCLLISPHLEIQKIERTWAPIDPATVSSWKNLVRLIAKFHYFHSSPAILHPPESVTKIIRDYANEVGSKVNEDPTLHGIESFCMRWPEYAWKLLLVMHACAYKEQAVNTLVQPEMAKNAVQIMRWLSERQREILAPVQGQQSNDRFARLIKILDATELKEVTMRILKCSHNYGEAELNLFTQKHPHMLEIVSVNRVAGPGRPSTKLRLKVS